MKTGSQFKEKLQRIQNTRQAGGRAQPRAEGPGRAAGQGAGRFLTTASNHAPRASPKCPPNICFRLSISEENSHYQVEGKTPHMPGTSDFEALEQLPLNHYGKTPPAPPWDREDSGCPTARLLRRSPACVLLRVPGSARGRRYRDTRTGTVRTKALRSQQHLPSARFRGWRMASHRHRRNTRAASAS